MIPIKWPSQPDQAASDLGNIFYTLQLRGKVSKVSLSNLVIVLQLYDLVTTQDLAGTLAN